MFDQNLWTIFIALTAGAILIQTGILLGFYFLSAKLNRQADQIMGVTQRLLGPVQNAVENLQTISQRLSEFSSKMPEQLRQFGSRWNRPAA
jgi:hypothetical protein